MATKLFVGSLPYSVNDDELNTLFQEYGTVESAKVIVDRDTNRSKGFGFVEMSTPEEAQAAIEALNNKEIGERRIIVNEARPQEDRGPRPGGGGFGGNRGGGGGDFRRERRY